ncbi:MAG TPA: caspase family protein, partial [Pyrinomonadaceae bacterium]|nr:caspase family protein [Pyrinomonadaceae bacterium]
GKLVAFAEGYTIKFWEVATGKELPALNVPNSGQFTTQGRVLVNFSDDGKRLVTGGFDTPTILWDAETGKQLVKMSGRTNMAYRVAFNADGSRLWSGGRTRWDLREGRGARIAPGPATNMLGYPSPDGKYLATYTANSDVVTILEVPSSKVLQRLAPAASGSVVDRVSFSPDSTMILTSYGPDPVLMQNQTSPRAGGLETQLRIWDVKSGRELRSLTVGSSGVEGGFNADGRTLATFGSMGDISIWDSLSGNRVHELKSSPLGNLGSMMGGTAGTAGTSGIGSIMRGAGKPGSMPTMPNMADISSMMTNMMGAMSAGTMGRSVTSMAFSPDGRVLATGGVESKSNFDLAAMMGGAQPGQKSQKGQKGPSRPGNNPPDPQDFMKTMKVETTGQIVLWDVSTGQEIGALKGHGKGVTSVAFSRDGRWLASGSTDNTIRIWDVAAKREVRTMAGHTSNIESIAFSPDGNLIASASDDGGTFLWDAKTGEHLLTLISLDDGGEWMVVTPQGLFDGTPVSWNQILWRYNQDTFNVAPIEWFFTEFYHPGLLSDILAGKRPRVAEDVSKKDRRQPVVKLSTPGEPPPTSGIAARKVKIKIEVADAPADKDHPQGTGARDLRLFRNGSLIKVWHGDVLKGQATVSLEEEITVTAGANRLTAYAFNRDNVKSKDAPLLLTGADSLKRAGTAYVVAVGLNNYANAQYNLKYAVADAQSFGDEVRARQTQIGLFEKVEVVTLLNENATKATILSALRRLAGVPEPPSLKTSGFERLKRVEPEDTVIVYFAGHGTAQAQRFYLIPHDLGYEGDRTKLSEDGLRSILAHSISDVELEDAVEGLEAGHLLLVIDACNSGQAL